jgi:S-DNA-T family DNA segregation ATPase FtsK/SpoIIIE
MNRGGFKVAQNKKTTGSSSKKNTAKRSRSASKTASAKNSGSSKVVYNERFGDSIYDEILMIVLILISVIVLISLFTSVMGAFGEIVNEFFKGLFGVSAYLLPIVVIAFCVWMLVSKDQSFAAVKVVALILFILSLSTFFQLVTEGSSDNYSDMAFVKRVSYFYKDATGLNGGMFGGTIAYVLYKVLGWGSYIVAFASIIISVMLGTGKSLVTFLGEIGDYFRARRKVKEYEIKARAENIREKEEKRAKKQELQEMKLRKKYEDLYNEKKQKKGNFNILINGEEGYETEEEKAQTEGLPVVDAVVFKNNDEPVKEEKNEAYDFCREVPDEEEMKNGDKFIEVLGTVKVPAGKKDKNDAKDDSILFNNIFGVEDNKAKKKDTEEVTDKKGEDTESKAENNKTDDSENTGNSNDTKVDDNDCKNESNEKINIDENNSGIEYDAKETDDNTKADVIPKTISSDEKPKAKIKDVSAGSIQNDTKAKVLEKPEVKEEPKKEYIFPPLSLLGDEPKQKGGETKADMMTNAKKLEDTLSSFGVQAKVIQINKGPTVTRYELQPSQGVKVSKIVNLSDDIALNLAATGIRIEAPIPGKAAVGIEVPNTETQSVYLKSVIESDVFKKAKSKLTFALGKDIAGNAVVTDIAKMPHLLIAGATGSGKSVCINTIITSILYKAKPEEVKMLLVDPKVVELSVYNGIPHLIIPVVTDPKKAAGALNWAVKEMLSRYQLFADSHVRDIKGYNKMKKEKGETDFMPQIVIIIDELADLMMASPSDVEDAICRLAQLARAAGMHLIIATQRPSVDVITGVIKANIPSRLAFAVSSGIDSRTILDSTGAEKLIGKGDMLFYPVGMNKPVRIQGAFVTDKEVEDIVEFIKNQYETKYDSSMIENITGSSASGADDEDKDEYYDDAVDLVVDKEKASVSMLQRQFRIGYNRAARIVDEMERHNIVGPEEGSKPRKVLISKDELEQIRNPLQDDE